MDDCGELHDDMCAYFELAGNAAAAAARQVRTRNNLAAQEKVRLRVFEDESSVLGRRVCVARKEKVQEGEVRWYVETGRLRLCLVASSLVHFFRRVRFSLLLLLLL